MISAFWRRMAVQTILLGLHAQSREPAKAVAATTMPALSVDRKEVKLELIARVTLIANPGAA